MSGTGLAYVSVAVRDVESVADTFERHFHLPRFNQDIADSKRQAPVFAVGRTNIALFELGDPFVGGAEKTGVHHMAVAVENLAQAAQDVAAVGLEPYSAKPVFGLGNTTRMLLDDTTGLPVRFSNSSAASSERQAVHEHNSASASSRQMLEANSTTLEGSWLLMP